MEVLWPHGLGIQISLHGVWGTLSYYICIYIYIYIYEGSKAAILLIIQIPTLSHYLPSWAGAGAYGLVEFSVRRAYSNP